MKDQIEKSNIEDLVLVSSEECPKLLENLIKYSQFDQLVLKSYSDLIQQKLTTAEIEHEVSTVFKVKVSTMLLSLSCANKDY